MKKKTKPNYYIEPEELREAVREMHEKGQMTERFAKHLLTI